MKTCQRVAEQGGSHTSSPSVTLRVLPLAFVLLLSLPACGAESGPELGTPPPPPPDEVTAPADPGLKEPATSNVRGGGRPDVAAVNAGQNPAAPSSSPAAAAAAIAAIKTLAGKSSCYKYSWTGRGQMPRGYIKGVALVFARAVCHQTRSDVLVVSKAKTSDTATDSLAHYSAIFSGLGLSNGVAGVDTLRHAYTLLLGLGMRESSGEHCCGRDTSASNTSSDSAEAGAWQTSWDSNAASTELPKLFARYKADSTGCLLDAFAEGVTCSAGNWADFGSGDGRAFQTMEKECPAFAAEYAAVMIRVQGGSAGHYGPLRTKAAEVRPECDAMFQDVQAVVQTTPSVCGAL